MDGTIPGRYTKHPFIDMIALFIAIMIIATFLITAVKENTASNQDTTGMAYEVKISRAEAECKSCEGCTLALQDSNVKKVFLTENIYNSAGDCIIIANLKGKTLDCEFKGIDGSNTKGSLVWIANSEDITITNCKLGRKENGIRVFNSDNTGIIANEITYSASGIDVVSSINSRIIGNTIVRPDETGISVFGASANNQLELNKVLFSRMDGIKISDTRTVLLGNEACMSEGYDIVSQGPSNFGKNNKCSKAIGWEDLESLIKPCSSRCSEQS